MSTPKVEIYTKAFCGFCHRAKRLLDEKGVDYTEYDITMGGPKRAEMIDWVSGQDYCVRQLLSAPRPPARPGTRVATLEATVSTMGVAGAAPAVD